MNTDCKAEIFQSAGIGHADEAKELSIAEVKKTSYTGWATTFGKHSLHPTASPRIEGRSTQLIPEPEQIWQG